MNSVVEDFQQFAASGGPVTAMPGDLLAWLDRDPRSEPAAHFVRRVEPKPAPSDRTSRG